MGYKGLSFSVSPFKPTKPARHLKIAEHSTDVESLTLEELIDEIGHNVDYSKVFFEFDGEFMICKWKTPAGINPKYEEQLAKYTTDMAEYKAKLKVYIVEMKEFYKENLKNIESDYDQNLKVLESEL